MTTVHSPIHHNNMPSTIASTSRPRYLASSSPRKSDSDKRALLPQQRPETYHRRSGTLKMSAQSALIAQERSRALYDAVSDGDILIDAVIAFPLDWQGIATELERCKRNVDSGDEPLHTMNPLATKSRLRSRRAASTEVQSASTSNQSSKSSSSSLLLSTLSPKEEEQAVVVVLSPDAQISQTDSDMLLLPLESISSAVANLEHPFSEEGIEMPELEDYPSSPHSSFSASSFEESPVSTPPATEHLARQDSSFDLKYYCSLFGDSDSALDNSFTSTPFRTAVPMVRTVDVW